MKNIEREAALMFMMEMIVKDQPLSKSADELTRAGHRNRDANLWTAAQVFDMLPRLIEVGPRIFANREYIARKQSQVQPPQ